MRRTLLTLLVCFPALVCSAARPAEGRWEGRVEIPGSELQLTVDLAQGSTGGWAGSIVIPGLGVKGATLSNLVVTDTDVSFDLGQVLGSATQGPAGFRAHLVATDSMAGQMRQAGSAATLVLRKIGPAQVELSPRSTPVRLDVEDQWVGEYELGGYPRHVTITLENHADAGASAKFVIVGKMTNDLPVDLVVQQGNLLRVESQSTQVSFEGRVVSEASEIRGTLELGSIELPLVLHRARRAS
jgi:hypothetical protein